MQELMQDGRRTVSRCVMRDNFSGDLCLDCDSLICVPCLAYGKLRRDGGDADCVSVKNSLKTTAAAHIATAAAVPLLYADQIK